MGLSLECMDNAITTLHETYKNNLFLALGDMMTQPSLCQGQGTVISTWYQKMGDKPPKSLVDFYFKIGFVEHVGGGFDAF